MSDFLALWGNVATEISYKHWLEQQLDVRNQWIATLKNSLAAATEDSTEMMRQCDLARKDAEEAEAKLADAKAALEYYANKSNWGSLPKMQSSSHDDCLQIDERSGYAVAAQALAQINEEPQP